ncbi:MAG: FHA domain-containing protein [Deltaproteobacteria bacterium]|nr:FHA domain-containing protein [Deltaproteobacteria bacterium]
MPTLGTLPFKSPRAQKRQVVRLVSVSEESQLCIELQPGINRVGRHRADNHIVLISPQISRFHAEITVEKAGGVEVNDLGSANGTFLNHVRVEAPCTLCPGDILTFADQFSLRVLMDISIEEPERVEVGTLDTKLPSSSPPPGDPTGHWEPPSLRERREAFERSSPNMGIAEVASTKSVRIEPGRPVTLQPPTLMDMGEEQTPGPLRRPAKPTEPIDPAQVAKRGLAGAHVHPHQELTPATERERRKLAVLEQMGQRCDVATTMEELDALLINVLERTVAFDRGFVSYPLPSGQWRLVMSPRGQQWDRDLLLVLVRQVVSGRSLLHVVDSRQDPRLGSDDPGDKRVLLPLWSADTPEGMIFLASRRPDSFDSAALDFLQLFGDVAALSLNHMTQRYLQLA